MKRTKVSFRSNAKLARERWGLSHSAIFRELKELTSRHSLSIAAGDLQLLNGRLYITHSGLLWIAFRKGCSGIETTLLENLSDALAGRWIFRATVFKRPSSKGFVGYGDAAPSNVSFQVRGSEMRVAETRAVNRALRKAYGIALCSAEELPSESEAPVQATSRTTPASANASAVGQPRLRDQLCLLIRRFQLDPSLVKHFAADYCGAPSISAADRQSLESFVSHLKKLAEDNRDALICKLNSYAPAEVGT